MPLKGTARKMVEILGLKALPVAIKFREKAEESRLPERKMRYCQALMLARHGEEVLLTAENIACPAAAAAFGFKPLPPKIAEGEMLTILGLFATLEAAKRTMSLMPRLEKGKYEAVHLIPLAAAENLVPDVVVVEGLPEQLMWIILASIFNSGGRLSFETGVFQATCVDATVVPFIKQRLNACFGCYGCREASDIEVTEAVLGFPGNMLGEVVRGLEYLARKALPKARSKTVYHAF